MDSIAQTAISFPRVNRNFGKAKQPMCPRSVPSLKLKCDIFTNDSDPTEVDFYVADLPPPPPKIAWKSDA